MFIIALISSCIAAYIIGFASGLRMNNKVMKDKLKKATAEEREAFKNMFYRE